MSQKQQRITYNAIEDGIVHPHLHLTMTFLLLFEDGVEVDSLDGLCLLHSVFDDVLLLGHSGLLLQWLFFLVRTQCW